MADPTGEPSTPSGSLLADLGRLRAQREAETTTDVALPGFADRLWATFRLPKTEKASQLQMVMAGAAPQTRDLCLDMIARSTVGLYLAEAEGAQAPIRGDTGTLNDGFTHIGAGDDIMPMTFDHRLESIPELCPPLAQGKMHTPESRVRTLFASDGLVIQCAVMIVGWALGGGDAQSELEKLSERYVGESNGGPR